MENRTRRRRVPKEKAEREGESADKKRWAGRKGQDEKGTVQQFCTRGNGTPMNSGFCRAIRRSHRTRRIILYF
jgi:hypothetical protein